MKSLLRNCLVLKGVVELDDTLYPCDYFISPKLKFKSKLKEKQFDTILDIQHYFSGRHVGTSLNS